MMMRARLPARQLRSTQDQASNSLNIAVEATLESELTACWQQYLDQFSSARVDELTRHHHVRPCRKWQSGNSKQSSYHYRAPNPTEACEMLASHYSSRPGVARLIPLDGRIALALDMQCRLRYAEVRWKWLDEQSRKTKEFSVRHPNDSRAARSAELNGNAPEFQKYMRTARETAACSLESFFCEDFQEVGTFIVWDIDPEKGAEVLYRLEARQPSVEFKELHQGIPRRKQVFYGQEDRPRIQDFLASQAEFCRRDEASNAVWQRVILCQGLSYASVKRCLTCTPAASWYGEVRARNIPFLAYDHYDDPIRLATDLHLSDECRGGSESANPYSDPHSSFHITFFERRETWDSREIALKERSKSKIGELYSRPSGTTDESGSHGTQNLVFRRSSFTVLSTCRRTEVDKETLSPSNSDFYWTMLVMSPSRFFHTSDEEGVQGLADVCQSSRQVAEFSCIITALKKVESQWQWFDDYIGSLIAENFMDPTSYNRLLFDDATFSRSRLYFWIFGCLNEFDVIVGDNIKQLDLYRVARIEPILMLATRAELGIKPWQNVSDSLPTAANENAPKAQNKDAAQDAGIQFDLEKDLAWLRELDKEAQNIQQSLENLTAHFKVTQTKVQALRDGLFNASALMETRASRQLGLNVQLLTYVSIFYLPLAFCAALWAIPNISDKKTLWPFVTAAALVGFVTYAAVFNLENIAGLLGKAWFRQRDRLLEDMQREGGGFWRPLRQRFDKFPPDEPQGTPSEWWIFWYSIKRVFRRGSLRDDKKGEC